MELRSLAESSAASTPEKNVVLSATRRDFRSCEVDIGYQILPQANRNEVASKLEQATQAEKLIIDTAKTEEKEKAAPIEASGQEQADEYDELESFEVPPFPLIDKREMVVNRAVLQSMGASAGAQATDQAAVQRVRPDALCLLNEIEKMIPTTNALYLLAGFSSPCSERYRDTGPLRNDDELWVVDIDTFYTTHPATTRAEGRLLQRFN
jgi:hypothetical protein